MARNIPVGYAYEPRVNVMRVSVYENLDFKDMVLTSLCPTYN